MSKLVHQCNMGGFFPEACYVQRQHGPEVIQQKCLSCSEPLQVNGKYIVKSGTDFRQFSEILLTFSGQDNNNNVDVQVSEVSVTLDLEEDPVVKDIVKQYTGKLMSCLLLSTASGLSVL